MAFRVTTKIRVAADWRIIAAFVVLLFPSGSASESAAKHLVMISYSDKSSGGSGARRSILNLTVGQWSRLGFEVHVVSDTVELDLPCATRLVQASSEDEEGSGGYQLPWRAITYLKGVVGPATEIVAYAEDDLFMPAETLQHWKANQAFFRENKLRLGFHRVETDGESLTDTTLAWDSWRFHRAIYTFGGWCYVQLENPHSAMFMMTGGEFRDEYIPSPWSSWETCRPFTFWGACETASAGLAWLGRGEADGQVWPVVTSVEQGHVLHLWPMKGRPYPYVFEHGKYTRRHLRLACTDVNFTRRWRRALFFTKSSRDVNHPRHAVPKWIQQPGKGALAVLLHRLDGLGC